MAIHEAYLLALAAAAAAAPPPPPPSAGSTAVQGWSFVVASNADGMATAHGGGGGGAGGGATVFSGEPSEVINRCVAELPQPGGGTVFLRSGAYVLASPIVINRPSVEIRGENAGGDLFFSSDDFYHGYRNKTATVLIAVGTDAIQVGTSPACRTPNPRGGYFQNGTHCLVFGIAIRDLAVSGVADPSDGIPPAGNYTPGAGVRVQKADTIRIENVEVRCKEHGVMLGQLPAPFAYDRVIDVLTVNNLYLAYNLYGLWQTGWCSNVRIRNLFGYENLRSLLHAETKYDWLIDGVMSQADGNQAVAETDAPIYITTRQDVTVRHVTVASNLINPPPAPLIPLVYVGLGEAKDGNGEWYRGHVKMDTLTLFGTNADAIKVVGTGMVDIRNIHAGGTGSQSFYGGPGVIGGRCVNVAGPNADVTVAGGFCNSNLTASGAPREAALFNVSKVSDVRGVSPVGRLPTPFSAGAPGRPTVGLGGAAASPQPGACYAVHGADVLLSVVGNEADVELRDADGETVFGKLGSGSLKNFMPLMIPVGWEICFANFSASPTPVVTVGGA